MKGKKVVIYFNDKPDSVNRWEGIITSKDKDFITLDNKIVIPISKIVRIEVKNG